MQRAIVVIFFAACSDLPAQVADPIPTAATLEAEFGKAQLEWNLKSRAARAQKDAGAQARLRAARPRDVFVPRFLAGAEAHGGTERAVPYLAWLVQRAPFEQSQRAMVTLMSAHVESSEIRLAVARIGGLKQQFGIERSRTWLDRVLEKNKDPDVVAQARYTRAAMYVGTRAVAHSDELRAQAIADLRAVVANPGARSRHASLLGLAARLLDEAERLEPGLPAPEIEGVDLDGVAFKLSDYRGKVVMLDFWGDW
tara:strand:+ start:33443 stop:34204 length:762 start_codon:yes stop_codon:yes gene_type:complete